MVYMDRLPGQWDPIGNAELRIFMGAIYNGWFTRWRDRAATATDAEWSQMIDEADLIISKAGGSRTAEAIGAALIRELEARRAEAMEQKESA